MVCAYFTILTFSFPDATTEVKLCSWVESCRGGHHIHFHWLVPIQHHFSCANGEIAITTTQTRSSKQEEGVGAFPSSSQRPQLKCKPLDAKTQIFVFPQWGKQKKKEEERREEEKHVGRFDQWVGRSWRRDHCSAHHVPTFNCTNTVSKIGFFYLFVEKISSGSSCKDPKI